jgi:hypothetical protein
MRIMQFVSAFLIVCMIFSCKKVDQRNLYTGKFKFVTEEMIIYSNGTTGKSYTTFEGKISDGESGESIYINYKQNTTIEVQFDKDNKLYYNPLCGQGGGSFDSSEENMVLDFHSFNSTCGNDYIIKGTRL